MDGLSNDNVIKKHSLIVDAELLTELILIHQIHTCKVTPRMSCVRSVAFTRSTKGIEMKNARLNTGSPSNLLVPLYVYVIVGKNRKHVLKNPIYSKKCTIISKENIVQI